MKRHANNALRRALIVAAMTMVLPGLASGQENAEDKVESFRLVFQFIEANGAPGVDERIKDVVTELKKLFRFEGYKLRATSVLRMAIPRTWSSRSAGSIGTVPGRAVGSQRIVLEHPGSGPMPEKWALLLSAQAERGRRAGSIRLWVRVQDVTYASFRANVQDLEKEPDVFRAAATIRDKQSLILGSTHLVMGKRGIEGPAFILVVRLETDES